MALHNFFYLKYSGSRHQINQLRLADFNVLGSTMSLPACRHH